LLGIVPVFGVTPPVVSFTDPSIYPKNAPKPVFVTVAVPLSRIKGSLLNPAAKPVELWPRPITVNELTEFSWNNTGVKDLVVPAPAPL
jgi:hypothetical protein